MVDMLVVARRGATMAAAALLAVACRIEEKPPATTLGDDTAAPASSLAGGQALQLASIETVEPQLIEPQVAVACDSVGLIVTEQLYIQTARADGAYTDQFRGERRVGCRIVGSGSLADLGDEGPINRLQRALVQDRRWIMDLNFSSDGPDGSMIGVRMNDVLCILGGSWLGHDDSAEPDTTPPAEQELAYDVRVECARDTNPPLRSSSQ